jgi:hypothetical protein
MRKILCWRRCRYHTERSDRLRGTLVLAMGHERWWSLLTRPHAGVSFASPTLLRHSKKNLKPPASGTMLCRSRNW